MSGVRQRVGAVKVHRSAVSSRKCAGHVSGLALQRVRAGVHNRTDSREPPHQVPDEIADELIDKAHNRCNRAITLTILVAAPIIRDLGEGGELKFRRLDNRHALVISLLNHFRKPSDTFTNLSFPQTRISQQDSRPRMLSQVVRRDAIYPNSPRCGIIDDALFRGTPVRP
jgi:hypothetical protein